MNQQTLIGGAVCAAMTISLALLSGCSNGPSGAAPGTNPTPAQTADNAANPPAATTPAAANAAYPNAQPGSYYPRNDNASATAAQPAPAAAPAGTPAPAAATAAGSYYARNTAAPAPTSVEGDYADVTDVRPVTEKVSTPRKVCEQVAVTQRAPGDGNHALGTAVGAVVGGLLGNQIGRGRGRTATTVAGAVGGGIVGHRIGEQHDANNRRTTMETRCRMVNESSDKVVAYDVTYVYRGKTYSARMDHDPGRRLRVEATVAPASPPPR